MKKVFTVFLILSLFACKTTPPAWITQIPEGTGNYEIFTASGTGENTTEAEAIANKNLISEIVRQIGVSVRTKTTATTFGDVENLSKFIQEEIQQNAEANIAKLKIKERYISKENGFTTIYLLAEYDKNELIKEQTRIFKLRQEKLFAVERLSKEADTFFNLKQYYKAAAKYVKAACTAVDLNLNNAKVKFDYNVDRGLESVDFIKFDLSEDSSGNKANSFSISCNEAKVPFEVNYTIRTLTKKQKVLRDKVVTDKNGNAKIVLKLPDESCKGKIILRINPQEIEHIFDITDTPNVKEVKKHFVRRILGNYKEYVYNSEHN